MTLVFCSYWPRDCGAWLKGVVLFGVLRLFYNVNSIIIVKNRSDAYAPYPLGMQRRVISGSNEWNEFGAWVQGRAALDDPSGCNEPVMFANDTLLRHGRLSLGEYVDLICHVFGARKGSGLGGFVSRIPWENCRIDGVEVVQNVCTKLFWAQPSLLDDELINRASEEARLYVEGLESHRLSSEYHAFLDSWLHGGGRWRWYRARPKDEMPRSERMMKATMILCEHFLTFRAGDNVERIDESTVRRGLRKLRVAAR